VGLLLAGGLALRFHDLAQIHLWEDETDFFTTAIYSDPPQPLVQYMMEGKNRTTNSSGWFGAVWLTTRAFGKTIQAGRTATVLAGAAAIPAFYFLILLAATGTPRPKTAALTAAIFATVSIPLIEFSQRTYAYGAVPFFAAMLAITHLRLVDALRDPASTSFGVWLRFALAASVGLFVHPSLALPIAGSAVLAGVRLILLLRAEGLKRCARVFAYAGCASLPVLASIYINGKNPTAGLRIYLLEYYPPSALNGVPFFLSRTYDMFSYMLNLFFDPRLYWPLSLNPVLLPLIALSLFGWIASLLGRNGQVARNLAIYGTLALGLQAALSFSRYFPYGGVRQSLFLAPFAIGFTGIGAGMLWNRAFTRHTVAVFGVLYIALWAWHLPSLYRDRTSVYSGEDIISLWRAHKELPLFVSWGTLRRYRYETRAEPSIAMEELHSNRVAPLPPDFLFIASRYPLDQTWPGSSSDTTLPPGYKAQLLIERPAALPRSMEHRTMLYFPPHGYWVYRVTKTPAQ
jgi:hypothetical protein